MTSSPEPDVPAGAAERLRTLLLAGGVGLAVATALLLGAGQNGDGLLLLLALAVGGPAAACLVVGCLGYAVSLGVQHAAERGAEVRAQVGYTPPVRTSSDAP